VRFETLRQIRIRLRRGSVGGAAADFLDALEEAAAGSELTDQYDCQRTGAARQRAHGFTRSGVSDAGAHSVALDGCAVKSRSAIDSPSMR
jgi:hypothetical protein